MHNSYAIKPFKKLSFNLENTYNFAFHVTEAWKVNGSENIVQYQIYVREWFWEYSSISNIC